MDLTTCCPLRGQVPSHCDRCVAAFSQTSTAWQVADFAPLLVQRQEKALKHPEISIGPLLNDVSVVNCAHTS